MRSRIAIAIILLLTPSGAALAKQRKLALKVPPAATSFSLGLTQMQGAKLKPITQASLGATYDTGASLKLGLSQSFTKNYLINQDGDEFALSDTNLSLTASPASSGEAWSYYGSLATTLPVSERSERHEVRTITSLAAGAEYAPWPVLSLGAELGGSYHFNRFDSEPVGDAGSGAALPQHSLYIEQSSRLNFLKSAFFGYSFTFSETAYHKIEEEALNSSDRDISDQAYQIKVSTGYNFSIVSASIGFVQGTLIELPGITEYVLFDEERTIGFLSLGTRF